MGESFAPDSGPDLFVYIPPLCFVFLKTGFKAVYIGRLLQTTVFHFFFFTNIFYVIHIILSLAFAVKQCNYLPRNQSY